MSKFDSSKPFGQVFGSAVGIRYEQGGRFYDAQKRLVDSHGQLVKTVKTEAENATPAEPAPVEPAPVEPAPVEPAKAAAKPSTKKPAAKKSEPEGVKPLREQAKEEAQ